MSEKTTTTSGDAPSPMELVQEFHRTYSMPIRSFDEPTLSYDRLDMRMSLIAEEFAELMGAHARGRDLSPRRARSPPFPDRGHGRYWAQRSWDP